MDSTRVTIDRVRIRSEPANPSIGDSVVMSVEVISGAPLSEDAVCTWTLRYRDSQDDSPVHGQVVGTELHISEWTVTDHATYYAVVLDGDRSLRAARTVPPALRLALSGGGFRATLFGAGALLYLVDAQVNHRVEDIASVSGGSILNAFIRDRCDYTTTTPQAFWSTVGELAELTSRPWFARHTRVPELMLRCLWGVPRLLVAIGVLTAIWMTTDGTLRGILIAAACCLLAGAFTLRGFTVERMLLRRYRLRGGIGSPELAERRRVTHVFCATDLVVGEPFYFLSTVAGGFFYSRSRGAAREDGYPVRKAVRASAAFPGAFLPKRVRVDPASFEFGDEPYTRTERFSGHLAYCADGGASNNLGTQWDEEQVPADWPYRLIFGSHLAEGARWSPGREIVEVAMDASMPISSTSSFWYHVPLLAEAVSFTRVSRVLYENTVTPRQVDAAWERSWLVEQGLEREEAAGWMQIQRGAHRHVLLTLDERLPERLWERSNDYSTIWARPEDLKRRVVEAYAIVDSEPDTANALTAASRMPTTLFRRSRDEVADAILAGYLGALAMCHTYEATGVPDNVAETLDRIRALRLT